MLFGLWACLSLCVPCVTACGALALYKTNMNGCTGTAVQHLNSESYTILSRVDIFSSKIVALPPMAARMVARMPFHLLLPNPPNPLLRVSLLSLSQARKSRFSAVLQAVLQHLLVRPPLTGVVGQEMVTRYAGIGRKEVVVLCMGCVQFVNFSTRPR